MASSFLGKKRNSSLSPIVSARAHNADINSDGFRFDPIDLIQVKEMAKEMQNESGGRFPLHSSDLALTEAKEHLRSLILNDNCDLFGASTLLYLFKITSEEIGFWERYDHIEIIRLLLPFFVALRVEFEKGDLSSQLFTLVVVPFLRFMLTPSVIQVFGGVEASLARAMFLSFVVKYFEKHQDVLAGREFCPAAWRELSLAFASRTEEKYVALPIYCLIRYYREVCAARKCAFCNKNGAGMICGACRTGRYCSSECQKKDWRQHQSACDLFVSGHADAMLQRFEFVRMNESGPYVASHFVDLMIMYYGPLWFDPRGLTPL